jgi:hypothetical protein
VGFREDAKRVRLGVDLPDLPAVAKVHTMIHLMDGAISIEVRSLFCVFLELEGG